jgi:Mrp family chromosome partitioning ATPase
MGKIFDTLGRNGNSKRIALASTASPGSALPVEEPAFIEIGPHREVIAASPSVLAEKPVTNPVPLAGPRSPLFRALPSTLATKPAPMPPAATLRRPRMAAELVAYHTPDHPVSLRYSELLSAVLDATAVKSQATQRIINLCPIRGGIGSTTVLLNLSIIAARQGNRVLVVDAHFKAPALANRLGLTPAPGLMELLSGECTLDEAARPTDQEGLFALTAGQQGPFLADTATIEDMLIRLRERFDLVLMDGPRWEGKPTCLSLFGQADAVFLVVPASEADSAPANEWMRTLPQQGIRLAGSILTVC